MPATAPIFSYGPVLPPGFELVDPAEGRSMPDTPVPAEPAADLPSETWGEYAGGIGLKAAQGLTFNYADEIASAIGSLVGYDREELLADLRDADEAFQQRHPVAAPVAEVGGALVSGLGTGVGMLRAVPTLARAGGITRAAGTGAAIGAPVGALSATGATEGDESLTDAALSGVAFGGLSGGAFGGAGNSVGRVVGPWATEAAQTLRGHGIRLTSGELLGGAAKRAEDSLGSVPFVGQLVRNRQADSIDSFNRTAANQVLHTIDRRLNVPATVETGHDTIAAAQDILMSARIDQGLVADVQAVRARMPQAMQADFDDAVARHIDNSATFAVPGNPMSGTLDGRGLQNALGGLRDEGCRLITSQSSNAYARDLGQGLLGVRDAVIAAAGRSTPGRTMTRFNSTQRAYAAFSRLRNAASRVGAEGGVFTPAQLMAAVRAGDRSAGKGATATGNAVLQDLAGPGKSVMGRRVNDSGTSDRVALLAAISSPASIPTAIMSAAPLAALYTPLGRAAFERLAAGSPHTRALLSQIVQQFSQRAAPAAAAAFGG